MGKHRNIVVVPYNPAWPAMFRREVDQLAAVFGSELVEIHHIGSTSIPNMWAKPIIDMMPVVQSIDRVDALNDSLAALGYEAMGENGIPGRRYFRRNTGGRRSHHAHVFAADNEDVARHLIFRDYLIAHPDAAAEYAALKRGLARQFPHDIDGYWAGKDPFIREVTQKAYRWHSSAGEAR